MLQTRYTVEVRDCTGNFAKIKDEPDGVALFGNTKEPTLQDIERCINRCEGEGLVAFVEKSYVKIGKGKPHGLQGES